MQALRTEESGVAIELTKDELLMLNAALNEVCNGVRIPEFQTRLGFEKAEVKELLERIHELIVSMRSAAK
jgi:hypothetical protein